MERALGFNELKAIMTACSTVLERAVGVAPSSRSVIKTPSVGSENPVVIVARFNGNVAGHVFLGFSETTACGLAGRIYKLLMQETTKFAAVDNEVNELLIEFANMLFNQIMESLKGVGVACTMEVPKIWAGGDSRNEGGAFLMTTFPMGPLGQMSLYLDLSVKLAHASAGRRVMIVDDSPSLRGIMREILSEAGYTVVGEAVNGREAIAHIGALAPDLVTMDIEMPEINGVQALAAIKVSNPKVKVVMVTTIADKERVLECLAKGASNYILKPYEPARVLEAVERALG